METVFDKILTGDIPAEIVYEDDDVLAFLDRTPVHKGHTLIIPKTKCTNILDCPAEVVGKVYGAAQKMAQHMKKVLHADGVNIHGNNEPAAGQEVMYFHVHVIPRYAAKKPFASPTHEEYTEGEMEEYGQKLHLKSFI